MTVTVLFFAHYQDRVGAREQRRALPDGATVRSLAEALGQEYPALASLLSYARVAVNADYADADTVLRDGDEVALMPPMSGGRPTPEAPFPAPLPAPTPLPARLGSPPSPSRGRGLRMGRVCPPFSPARNERVREKGPGEEGVSLPVENLFRGGRTPCH